MPALIVVVSSGSWLLVLAGANKIRHPEGTAPALTRITQLANTRALARVIGIAELVIALSFLIFPAGWSSLLVGAWYSGLLVTAWTLKSRETDCGCFGAASTEVTLSHLVVTGLIAVSGLLVWALATTVDGSSALYWLSVASLPITLAWYGLLVPMTTLRARLRELQA